MEAPHIIRSANDPATAPTAIGIHWFNTVLKKEFISVGTASSADWVLRGVAGGSTAWGAITGTVTDQTDLVTYITGKISDTAYNAGTWDAVTTIAPSKNAVRDQIETMLTSINGLISDTAYNATSWDAVTAVAPSKNAVRDQVETMLTSIATKITASSADTLTNKGIDATTNTITNIANAEIKAAAAIAVNKLAALTVSKVAITDASGFLTTSSVTPTTLAFLDATSSVQTQINTANTNITANTASILLKSPYRGDKWNQKFNDWHTTAEEGWALSNSGGTSTIQTTGANATENVQGAVRLTVTATNDRSSANFGTGLYIGSGSGVEFIYAARMCFTTSLPDGTDTAKLYMGVCDSTTGNGTTEPANGVYFRYDPTVNAGKFQAVNRTSSADTNAVDTGFSPTLSVNDIFEIDISSAGVATFYINGSQVAQVASSLSVPGALAIPFNKFLKTAGASARLCTFDWNDIQTSRSAAR